MVAIVLVCGVLVVVVALVMEKMEEHESGIGLVLPMLLADYFALQHSHS